MELNWLESIIYGFISGFTEFLPICPDSHRFLFLQIIGASDSSALRLAVHLGAFIALLTLCTPMIARLNRERKIAAVSEKRRKRQPDMRSLCDIRLLKAACLPLVLCMAFYLFAAKLEQHVWLLALFLFLNGCLLYFPQFSPSANKDGLTLSTVDAVYLGLAMGFGILPGISRIGSAISVASFRGADKRYVLDILFLLSIPVTLILLFFDVIAVFAGVGVLSFTALVCCFSASLLSFAGAYLSICMMRFFAVRVGFSGFSYYSWGLALLSLILFLTIS